jgi:hypothetical protein
MVFSQSPTIEETKDKKRMKTRIPIYKPLRVRLRREFQKRVAQLEQDITMLEKQLRMMKKLKI